MWLRLPAAVTAFFEAIDLEVYEVTALKNAGDAGRADICFRSELPGHVLPGVLAHEMGHVAGAHFHRVANGELSADAAEQEADRYARSWGFSTELAAAQRWRDGSRPVIFNGVYYYG